MMIIKRDENLSFLILTRVLFCGIITYRIKPMRIFMLNTDKLQRFGFRKSKATRGLCAAVLGSFILENGANVHADTLFNGETQQTPISTQRSYG